MLQKQKLSLLKSVTPFAICPREVSVSFFNNRDCCSPADIIGVRSKQMSQPISQLNCVLSNSNPHTDR